MTWFIFLAGTFFGVFLGFVIASLCTAAGDADRWSERK